MSNSLKPATRRSTRCKPPASKNRTRKAKACLDAQREAIYREGCGLLLKDMEDHAIDKPRYQKILTALRKKYGRSDIGYGTLRNRFLGTHQNYWDAAAERRILSPTQERVVVEWLQYLADTGHPVSKRTVRKKVYFLTGGRKLPSYGWVFSFVDRHPSIQLGRPSGLDPKRAQAFNKPVVGRHFELLRQIIEKHRIPPKNIFNMDEKGCQRGVRRGSTRKFFVRRDKRPKHKNRSANLELTTIIECVCADGSKIDPGFVFSGKEYEMDWFPPGSKVCVSTSENGWTSDHLCLEWFKKCFIPQAQAHSDPSKPILLIYDGHGSHETLDLLLAARSHNIILFCLPPHTTHKLQPLDVGVFGPFSAAWKERCDEIVDDDDDEMSRADFVKEYMAVREKTFTEHIITRSFAKTGIEPLLGIDVFDDRDFAPSLATSTSASGLPPSFPLGPTPSQQSNTVDNSLPDEPDSDSDSVSDDDRERTESDDESLAAELEHEEAMQHDLSDDEFDEEREASPPPTSTPQSTPPSPPQVSPPSTTCSTPPTSSEPSSSASSLPPDPDAPSDTISHNSDWQPPAVQPLRELFPHLKRPPESVNWPPDAIAFVNKCLEQNGALRDKAEEAITHCALAGDQLAKTKRKALAKKAVKRPKLNVEARCLTEDEAIELAKKKDEERKKKEEARKEKKQARDDKERKDKQRREDAQITQAPFSGALKSKNKTDLIDVAYALGLSTDGVKADILSRITTHFESNPSLKDEARYIGLFAGPSRARPPAQPQAVSQPSNPPPPSFPQPQFATPAGFTSFGAAPFQVAPQPSTSTSHLNQVFYTTSSAYSLPPYLNNLHTF